MNSIYWQKMSWVIYLKSEIRMMGYHDPVLLNESVDGLITDPAGVYVDVTFGGGGHSALILKKINNQGKLFGFDQDPDAKENVLLDSRFVLIPSNFRYLKDMLRLEGIFQVDGILADLGVSSHQIDTESRGFSFRFNASMDMRMNPEMEIQASDILKTYDESNLQRIFSEYGELRNAKTLAKVIVDGRNDLTQMEQIESFLSLIDSCIRGKRNKYLSQVFQALRIEVNKEMDVLKEMLLQSIDLLKPGGRLSVISYHSLEDRLVKRIIQKGTFEAEAEKDFYGNYYKPLKAINKKIICASEEELKLNSRARSAKLRIAEKV